MLEAACLKMWAITETSMEWKDWVVKKSSSMKTPFTNVVTVLLAVVVLSLSTVECDLLNDYGDALHASYSHYACSRFDIPGLLGEPMRTNHGFKIKISGNPEKYVPGQMYTIVLQGDQRVQTTKQSAFNANGVSPGMHKFTEFLLLAESKDSFASSSSPSSSSLSYSSPSASSYNTMLDVGTFKLYSDSLVKLSDRCPNAVTQTTPVPKNEISVMWLAPPPGAGCIAFKATIVERKDLWYMDDTSLVKTICEEEADNHDEQPEIMEKCCACDEAKYEVTFEGLWSKYTHPKDFPSNSLSTHFSDIIGASHSSDFHIWQYGGYASEGVKQVAESGTTKKLESELKAESSKIRTIIKARGVRYPNLNGKTFAVFRVDSKHHLMSLLSVLMPSPDWIVGVSSLELCLKNCSWINEKVMNLYLWDAGIDSGVTYLSPDLPSIPQERIRRITSTSPNLVESPFYDPSGSKMKPMARLTVTRQRIYEKACGDEVVRFGVAEFEDSDASRYDCMVTEWTVFGQCSQDCGEGVRVRTRNYVNAQRAKEAGCKMKLIEKEDCGSKCVNNISCETTTWHEWSPCSTSCGRGTRVRTRKFMHREAKSVCTTVELVQRESCIAPVQECSGSGTGSGSDVERIDAKCAVTNWSEWSPCTEQCGKGVRIRTRIYINPHESKKVCNVQLIQPMDCMGENCQVDQPDNRNVCMLPKDVGPCRAYFPRYYFDASKGVCVQFIYGGCRGNRNNFARLTDCKERCESFSRDQLRSSSFYGNYSMNSGAINDQSPVVDCVVTLWSEWSPCSKNCGSARKERRREIKLNAQNGGRPCPRKLVQRRKCKDNPPCDEHDSVTHQYHTAKYRNRKSHASEHVYSPGGQSDHHHQHHRHHPHHNPPST